MRDFGGWQQVGGPFGLILEQYNFYNNSSLTETMEGLATVKENHRSQLAYVALSTNLSPV